MNGNVLGELYRIPRERDDLDDRELRLIDQARAGGATWEQIGIALNFRGDNVRAAAATRRARLARRLPASTTS